MIQLCRPSHPYVSSRILILVLISTHTNAAVDSGDTFSVQAGITSRYETNVFRLENTDEDFARATLGEDQADDTTFIGFAGVRFDNVYSLQRIRVDAKFSRYQYQQFDHLDATSHEYNALWGWSLTSRLQGSVKASREEFPDSYWNSTDGGVRNINLVENRSATFKWYLFGPWFLLGGTGEQRRENQSIFREQDNFSQEYGEAGIRYVSASDNSVELLMRGNRGEYTSREISMEQYFDTRYDQQDLEARAELRVFGKSRINAAATRFEREHDQFEQRDLDGTNWNLTYSWNVTGKLAASLTHSRNYGFIQTLNESYITNDSNIFVIDYATSAKSKLILMMTQSDREFGGAIINAPVRRTDKLKWGSLAWDWAISQTFSITPAIGYQRLHSNVEGREYETSTASLTFKASL